MKGGFFEEQKHFQNYICEVRKLKSKDSNQLDYYPAFFKSTRQSP